jgi:cellulose synthase/poly-beta-1,6-N-acetylglucosamine synthase-like glycosyltransferase
MSLKISVIIPCKNEFADIEDCIKSISNQTFPRSEYEILVVDGGSTDGTLELLKKYASVKVIPESGEHKSAANARNIGAKQAKGKILVFMDADTAYNTVYLERIYEHFKNLKIHAVTAKSVDFKNSTFLAKCYYAERCASTKKVHFGVHCVRVGVFKKLGGFNPKLGFGEDADLWSRFVKAGYKAVYEPRAISEHKEPRTWKEIWHESKWFGGTMLSLFVTNPIVGIRPLAGIAYRTIAPWILVAWLINGNILFFIFSMIWAIDNFYKILKALFVSKYILPSLLLPIFKTIRYYVLAINMFH